MTLTTKGKVYIIFIFLSALFTFLLVTNNYFPYTGFSLTFIIFSISAYFLKSKRGKDTLLYFLMTLIFSLFLVIRSEPLITFINLLATFYFGTLFLLAEKNLSVSETLIAPILLIGRSLLTWSDYKLEFKNNTGSFTKAGETLKSILISVLILAVIIPLLSSANPLFSHWLDFKALFEKIFQIISEESLFLWIVRIIFFLIFLYFLPKLISFINSSEEVLPYRINPFNFKAFLPKLLTAVVLGIFFVTQLQLYFSSAQTLAELGISTSSMAREVFGQLSLVTIIILGLIFFGKDAKKKKVLDYILLSEGVFLTFVALKSVYEYSSRFGFTYKRLYGFAVVFWLIALFILFIRKLIKNIDDKLLLKQVIISFGITLALVNIANFDYLIYHVSKAYLGYAVDYDYLSRLSPDSLSYKEQFGQLYPMLEQNIGKDPGIPVKVIYRRIEYLQKKYQNLDLRSFNLLEYRQYKDVKDINLDSYSSLIFPPASRSPEN